jgi:hypothetical protein
MRSLIAGFALFVCLALLAVPAGLGRSAAAPPHGARLGGLNLAAYCQKLGYRAAALRRSRFGPNHAYGNWVCVKKNGTRVSITASGRAPSMVGACRRTYPGTNAITFPVKPNDAWSWACYRPASTRAATTVAVKCVLHAVAQNYTCTATVTGGSTRPTGLVHFSAGGTGVFSAGDSCTLASVPSSAGDSSCSVVYVPPSGVPFPTVTVTYDGDSQHRPASGSTTS